MLEEIKQYIEQSIEDNRAEWKVEHKLLDIVVTVLLATLANADDWVEIGLWAKANEAFLKRYLELKNGVASHDTLQRVMSSIKPEVFRGLLGFWHELLDKAEGEKLKKLLAIDGKTICGNGNKNQEALHIVCAWSKENGVCFGQRSEDSKGKEIPMILDLLRTVSVAGQIVTIDAIGTQKAIAQKIREGRGDYVLAVKGNQGTLHEEVKQYFEEGEIVKELEERGQYKSVFEKAHGQLERREYWQSEQVAWLQPKRRNGGEQAEGWKGLASIGAAKTTCTDIESGTVKSVECRYYLSSLKLDVHEFERAVRGHWSVESMHWHLDVTFREDKNRTLDKNAAENLNIVRKWALSMLKIADLGMKLSLKKKRFLISCDSTQYLQKVIQL